MALWQTGLDRYSPSHLLWYAAVSYRTIDGLWWLEWYNYRKSFTFDDSKKLFNTTFEIHILETWEVVKFSRPIFLWCTRHYQNSQNIVSRKFAAIATHAVWPYMVTWYWGVSLMCGVCLRLCLVFTLTVPSSLGIVEYHWCVEYAIG